MSEDRVLRTVSTPFRKVDRFELPETVLSIPEDLNPLAEGIFMAHQSAWVADDAPLKLNEKGRRTGITWAEAQDDTLIAAASRGAGGDNVFYIGDTKEKGLEFIGYCAHFAKFIEGNIADIWEGETEVEYVENGQRVVERLASYTIRFASGYRISALASRPAVIRGLQGVVVIDEAAYHNNVKAVIDACNALLIWGGRIRIISTHNGVLNAFNELVKEIREGKWEYSLHRVTFDDAVANGLYERVCLVKGWKPTPEAKQKWYNKIRATYGTRLDVMRQELDAIPLEGGGTMLPIAWIEACMTSDYKLIQWENPAEDFVDWPKPARQAEMELWLRDNILPLIEKLLAASYGIGGDFALRVDRADYAVGYVGPGMILNVPFIVEFRACPYDQQKQALVFIGKNLPRLSRMVLDAGGNGMVLAQEMRQEFGANRVDELMATDAWYREFSPKFRERFESKTFLIPKHPDVTSDLKQFQMSPTGVWKIPSNVRTTGSDGKNRHADSGIALINLDAAMDGPPREYDYTPAKIPGRTAPAENWRMRMTDDDGDYKDVAWNKGAF